MKKTVILAALLVGCASANNSWHWEKRGAGSDEFTTDYGLCKAQAFGASTNLMQVAIVLNGCMEGHGWRKVAD